MTTSDLQGIMTEIADSAAVSDHESESDSADWIVDEENNAANREGARYIDQIKKSSGLRLLQPERIIDAYNNEKEYGLFRLFLPGQATDRFRHFANSNPTLQKPVSASEFNAYIGLELAMPLSRQCRIKDYWSSKPFLGHADFQGVMSRDRFINIRSAVKFHTESENNHFRKSHDPLWHSRALMTEFQKRCQQLAVPLFASALDENSCRTKARTKARSYLPSKPDKYAIRFYCVAEWRTLYLHTFFDNGSGNTMPSTPVQRYMDVFPDLRTPVGKICGKEMDSSTVLWSAMISQQTQRQQSPLKKRICFMDNFYTRHSLAQKVFALTQGEVRIIGTVRANYVEGSNRSLIQQAMIELKNAPRNKWILVRARDPVQQLPQKRRKKAQAAAKKILVKEKIKTPETARVISNQNSDASRASISKEGNGTAIRRESRVSAKKASWAWRKALSGRDSVTKEAISGIPRNKNFTPHQAEKNSHLSGKEGEEGDDIEEIGEVSPNSGFLIWKDNKVVIFYTNDLQKTPSKDVLRDTDEEAVQCVHGLCGVRRWTGNEVFHRSVIQVPAVIAAYNIFMNSVDRMDQLRSTTPTRRAEKRLNMSLFTWTLDLCAHNAYALYQHLREERDELPKVSFQEFKRRVVERLTAHGNIGSSTRLPPVPARKRSSAEMEADSASPPAPIDEDAPFVHAVDKVDHVLLQTNKKARLRCYLCSAQNKELRVSQACAACGKGFHTNCHAVFHNVDAVKHRPEIMQAINACKNLARADKRRKTSANLGTFDTISLGK